MSDEELFEALVERSALHEFVADVYCTVGNDELAKRENMIADLYVKMATLVCRFENLCLPE